MKAERLPNIPSVPQQTTQSGPSTHSPGPRNGEGHGKEYMSFEPVGMHERSLVFRKESELTVSAAENYVDARPAVSAYDHVLSSIVLPSEAHAVFMFNTYMKSVEHHHRVIHGPTVRALLSRVYSSLPCGQYPAPGHIALLLVIFASTAYSWRLSSEEQNLFASSDDCIEAARTWGISAVDILELSRRVTVRSLEDLQAMIIGASTFQYAEGDSRHASFLHTSALALARNLGLHKIDFPARPQTLSSPDAAIENEIRRRIWWHLAARDWYVLIPFPPNSQLTQKYRLLAFDWGRQDGTYSIHPRHMRVDYPLNADDDAIPADGSASSTADPNSSFPPTSMTFHLQHIRLAEICRSIADRLPPFFHSGSPAVDYDTILTLDAELQSFLDALPAFLRLDYSPLPTHSHQHPAAASWSCQRSLINAEVHARRIKLHHPFLWRSNAHAPSRTICLSSARAILDAGRLLVAEGLGPPCAGIIRAAILSHTFVAAITLVHDAQHTAGDGGDATQQQHEAAIAEARGTLERAARRSLRGKKFLHAFEGVVEKYSSSGQGRTGGTADGVVGAGGGGVADAAAAAAAAVGVGGVGGGGYGGGEGGELVGGGSGGGDLDVASWQALYADLELWDPGFA
ncbi:putative transcription factor lepB [Lasiodiplodia hormozganensis]|uniref:Transcription factor lepB n=1 Tax=Lasiodiplodia hormozganensis TaxID=869390 RepID=A0AA39XPI8_9PEZI|nr:putative transcription factor lepB [Lasiodiplodia hormozganensis]